MRATSSRSSSDAFRRRTRQPRRRAASWSIDYAISKIKEVNAFLQQDVGTKLMFQEEVAMLMEIFNK
jgi:hypothetical protein